LKGARPGADVTRCTEAGVYAPQFVQAVVQALQSLLTVGGRAFNSATGQSWRGSAE
jgi:hypothetical protein